MDLYQARRAADFIAFVGNYSGLVNTYGFIRKHLADYCATILTYHRVAEPTEAPWSLPAVTPNNFEKQIHYLRRYYEILPIEELVQSIEEKRPFSDRAAVITFDDGYKDNFTRAYPILQKYNVPATINITTANIDNREAFWWDKIGFAIWNTPLRMINVDELGMYSLKSHSQRLQTIYRITRRLATSPTKENDSIMKMIIDLSGVCIPSGLGDDILLSWNDIVNMKENGIRFGAHTVTHPNLTELPLSEAKSEITQSKNVLEQRLGQEISVFCYPNGNFTPQLAEAVKASGFECALTFIPRTVGYNSDLFQLGRIPGGWNVSTLKLFLTGPFTDLVKVPLLAKWVKT